jgi:hypothetical protein
MRYKPFCLLVTLFATALPTITRAAVTQDTFQLGSTADLVELCTASPSEPMGTAALNFCHGFGVGVFRVLQEIESATKAHTFCMPDPLPTRNEGLASFIQWAKANPDQLSLPPQDGIEAFLSKQYPCSHRK